MKRIEYQYLLRDRQDEVFNLIMKNHDNNFVPKELKEFPVKCFLGSYSEACRKKPYTMMRFYDLVKIERTGRKYRDIILLISIHFFLLKKKLLEIKNICFN